MTAEDLYEAAIQAEDEQVGLEIHGLGGAAKPRRRATGRNELAG